MAKANPFRVNKQYTGGPRPVVATRVKLAKRQGNYAPLTTPTARLATAARPRRQALWPPGVRAPANWDGDIGCGSLYDATWRAHNDRMDILLSNVEQNADVRMAAMNGPPSQRAAVLNSILGNEPTPPDDSLPSPPVDIFERTMRALQEQRDAGAAEREICLHRRIDRALRDAARWAFTAKLEGRVETFQRIQGAAEALQSVRGAADPCETLAAQSKLVEECGYKSIAEMLIRGRPTGDSSVMV